MIVIGHSQYGNSRLWQWRFSIFKYDYLLHRWLLCQSALTAQIAKFTGPTWGPPGSCRPQMGPMLAPWTLLSRSTTVGVSRGDKPCQMIGRFYSWATRRDVMTSSRERLRNSGLPWWRHQMETFSRYWPFVRGIHRSPLNSPHKDQWPGAFMLSLIGA